MAQESVPRIVQVKEITPIDSNNTIIDSNTLPDANPDDKPLTEVSPSENQPKADHTTSSVNDHTGVLSTDLKSTVHKEALHTENTTNLKEAISKVENVDVKMQDNTVNTVSSISNDKMDKDISTEKDQDPVLKPDKVIVDEMQVDPIVQVNQVEKEKESIQDHNQDEQDKKRQIEENNVIKEHNEEEIKNKRARVEQETKRGQRMMGMLLGTLNKTKQKMAVKSESELRRIEIEKKLGEKLAKEKQELASKVREESDQRRLKLQEQRKEEDAIRLKETCDLLLSHREHAHLFLKTKTNPVIFYLPAKHNKFTLELLNVVEDDGALEKDLDTLRAATFIKENDVDMHD